MEVGTKGAGYLGGRVPRGGSRPPHCAHRAGGVPTAVDDTDVVPEATLSNGQQEVLLRNMP